MKYYYAMCRFCSKEGARPEFILFREQGRYVQCDRCKRTLVATDSNEEDGYLLKELK